MKPALPDGAFGPHVPDVSALPALLAVLLAEGPPCSPPPTVLDWLASAPMRAGIERLLHRTRLGEASWESAAWVVPDGRGGVALRDWPFTAAFHRAAWTGLPPEGAVAIVHTHPNGTDPRPSDADRALAARLALPVYTLTRTQTWSVRPDGAVRREERAP